MDQTEQTIQSRLFSLQDVKYRDFQLTLIPSADADSVIGVRTPAIRALAKELAGKPETANYLKCLPHKYYDEYNLHGAILSLMKDYDKVVAGLDEFLPYVDNWATCDMISPKVFIRHLTELREKIPQWINSGSTYIVRFGIEMLMTFYLDGEFSPEYPEWVAEIKSDEYYINMMIAWYFATALSKQWDAAVPFIQEKRLNKWTHNKTIQKAVESFRITSEEKVYLRTLKIK